MQKEKIIISINPKYVNKILAGTKRYEYRTVCPKREVQSLLIYCTYPVKRVVAEAEVLKVIKDTPEKVWELTKEYADSTKQEFMDYYKNKKFAVAYKLGKINKFKNPKTLADYGVNFAPQSYIYAKTEKQLSFIEEN